MFTVAGAFALASTVAGADILADRLSDRRSTSATVVQLGGLTARFTLISTGDEARRFNVSDEFALLSGTFTVAPPACATLRAASASERALSVTFGQFVGANPGDAVDGVDCSDALAPTDDPLFVPRWAPGGDVVRVTLPSGGVGIDLHGS